MVDFDRLIEPIYGYISIIIFILSSFYFMDKIQKPINKLFYSQYIIKPILYRVNFPF